MMFPSAYRFTAQREGLGSLGQRSARTTRPARGDPASSSSTPAPQPTGCPGSRSNLGVSPGVGEFTTAVVIVFSLAAFLFLCGVCMLLGGLGDTSKALVILGVASVVGGVLLTAMGWTLCLKVKRKRNHQGGGVPYYTAVIPADELAVQPPAYALIDPNSPGLPASTDLPSYTYTPSGGLSGTPGYTANIDRVSFPAYIPTSPGGVLPEGFSSPPYTPSDVNVGSPSQDVASGAAESHSDVLDSQGSAGVSPGEEQTVFPFSPPSYDEAMLQNG